MDDLISKQAAIALRFTQAINEDGVIYVPLREYLSGIKSLPSAQQWIPCSERLPDYREVVLISTFWGVRMAERDAVKEDGTDDFWYLFLDDATAHPRYVYAWMPLPEPYKGEES